MNPITTLVLSYAILSVGAVPNTRSVMLLLRQKVPLQLHYCKDLGYRQTTAINFMKEDQKEAEKSNLFRTLVLLEKLGYSDLLKGYICAIYAPVYLPKLGTALPPCRSLCQNVKKACWNGFVPYIIRKCKHIFLNITKLALTRQV